MHDLKESVEELSIQPPDLRLVINNDVPTIIEQHPAASLSESMGDREADLKAAAESDTFEAEERAFIHETMSTTGMTEYDRGTATNQQLMDVQRAEDKAEIFRQQAEAFRARAGINHPRPEVA